MAFKILPYGYIILLNGKYIFYSGDAKTIDDYVISLFYKGAISHIYHDVTKYENNVHLYIKDLPVKIPENLRSIVTCMHFDDNETLKLAQELNFKVAKKSVFAENLI